MTAARMLTRFIWKPETPVTNAARRDCPVARSSWLRGTAGKVWKCSGRSTSWTALHSGCDMGCHLGSMAHAVQHAERSPVLAGPERAVGAVLHERHALLQGRRRVAREEVGREHGQIDVAVGGDPRVVHLFSLIRSSSNGAV